jgi:hypothetical protein
MSQIFPGWTKEKNALWLDKDPGVCVRLISIRGRPVFIVQGFGERPLEYQGLGCAMEAAESLSHDVGLLSGDDPLPHRSTTSDDLSRMLDDMKTGRWISDQKREQITKEVAFAISDTPLGDFFGMARVAIDCLIRIGERR